jgi:hypothetical protein
VCQSSGARHPECRNWFLTIIEHVDQSFKSGSAKFSGGRIYPERQRVESSQKLVTIREGVGFLVGEMELVEESHVGVRCRAFLP